MTRVIDCFPFFDEFLILDVRLRELYDVVDKFVIVESVETFTGQPKPLYLSDCIDERYPQYKDKIEVIVAPARLFANAWDREFVQKNHLCKDNLAHLNLDADDLILVSDADEIPRRAVIADMKENGYPAEGGVLAGMLFYYKFNVMSSELWAKAKFTPYSKFTDHTDVRYRTESVMIPEALWHFSYLKTPKAIQDKIKAFSHQEFNNDQFNTIDKISEKIEALSDLFDRPELSFSIVDVDDSFPEYVKEHREELRDWIA